MSAFCFKIIWVIKLSATPSKIIKGQEPKQTNQLFQALGDAGNKNLFCYSSFRRCFIKKTKKRVIGYKILL